VTHLRQHDLVAVTKLLVKHLTDGLALDKHTQAFAVDVCSRDRQQDNIDEADVIGFFAALSISAPQAWQGMITRDSTNAPEDLVVRQPARGTRPLRTRHIFLQLKYCFHERDGGTQQQLCS
jgi:hypothetical protein